MTDPNNTPFFSLALTTRGRSAELARLLKSLTQQTYKGFEVIVVDQNKDQRAAKICQDWSQRLRIKIVNAAGQSGVSRGRNLGAQVASGRYLLFPDDDCWYPDDFLSRAADYLAANDVDILTGRAADPETLRPINGRFRPSAETISRENVWNALIEWVLFVRSTTFMDLDGFDEAIGLGGPTPWQACEGQDFVLRAINGGASARFDPSFYGFHEDLNRHAPDAHMRQKGRAYGRGMGHVLRKHAYGPIENAHWFTRPLGRATLNLMRLRVASARYDMAVALGRYEGLTGIAPEDDAEPGVPLT